MQTIKITEIWIAGFSAVFLINIIWCLYVAYPITVSKHIKHGRSWLYLPLWWKGMVKSMVRVFTNILFWSEVSLGLILIWSYGKSLSPFILLGCAICLAALLFVIQAILLRHRFKQQENAYFGIRAQINRTMREKAIQKTEPEIDNLASFQFQSILREADKSRYLLKKISEQNKWAKKQHNREVNLEEGITF